MSNNGIITTLTSIHQFRPSFTLLSDPFRIPLLAFFQGSFRSVPDYHYYSSSKLSSSCSVLSLLAFFKVNFILFRITIINLSQNSVRPVSYIVYHYQPFFKIPFIPFLIIIMMMIMMSDDDFDYHYDDYD